MKKKGLWLLSILLLLFVAFTNVNAKSVSSADETVNEKGSYSSSRFIAGNKVSSKADIDGISFAAGNYVSLSGSADYGFYAGNSVKINGNVVKIYLLLVMK